MKKIIITFLLMFLLCSVTWAVDDPWTISFNDNFEGAGSPWYARQGDGGWYAGYGYSAPGAIVCQNNSNTMPGMSGQVAYGYYVSATIGIGIHLLPWPAEQLISDGNIVSVEVSMASRGGNCAGAAVFGFVTNGTVVQNGSWQEIQKDSVIVAGIKWGSRYAGVTTLESFMGSDVAGESFDVQSDNVVRQKLSLNLHTDQKKLEMKRYVSGAWETSWTTVFDWTDAGMDLSAAHINGVYIETGVESGKRYEMDDLSFNLTLDQSLLIYKNFVEDFNEFGTSEWYLRSDSADGKSSNGWYARDGYSEVDPALTSGADVLPGMSGIVARYAYTGTDGGYSIQMLPELADMLVSNSGVVTMEVSMVSRGGNCNRPGVFGFVVNGTIVHNGRWYEVHEGSEISAGLKWGSRYAGVTTLESFMGSDVAGESFDVQYDHVVRQKLSLDLNTNKMKLEMKRYISGVWESNWATVFDWADTGLDLSAANINGIFINPSSVNAENMYYYQMDDIEVRAYRSAAPVNCADAIAIGHGFDGDLDENCVVDMKDVKILTDTWLDCTSVGSSGCAPEQQIMVSPYWVYEGAVTIDGNLNEWSDANWINLDETYYGTPYDLENAKWAVKWSDSENLIYVAITGTDTYHHFTNIYDSWDVRDAVEIYVDAAKSNVTPLAPDYIEAQQWAVGPNNSGGNTAVWGGGYWTALADTGTPASIVAAVKVTGDVITYEVAVHPYSEYVKDFPSGSTEVVLAGGMTVGLDVVMGTRADGYGTFGMLCENAIGNKSSSAGNFRDFVLEGTGSCGDWGYLQADLNIDCKVNLQDFAILASDWLNSITF